MHILHGYKQIKVVTIINTNSIHDIVLIALRVNYTVSLYTLHVDGSMSHGTCTNVSLIVQLYLIFLCCQTIILLLPRR